MRDAWRAARESWVKSPDPEVKEALDGEWAGWVKEEREEILDEAVDNVIAAFTQVQMFGFDYDEFVTAIGDELRRRS